MKHTFFIYIALALLPSVATAQTVVEGVGVNSCGIDRSGSLLSVDLDLDISGLKPRRNRAVMVTPRLVNGADSIEMPSVAVYGRRRWFYYLRNGEENMLAAPDGEDYRVSKRPDGKIYHETYPYEDWMNGATLWLHRDLYGCCGTVLDRQAAPIGEYRIFEPTLVYMRPSPNKDPRYLEGSAYIDFQVDKTVIRPEYHNNASELARIEATIDSLRDDEDFTVTSVWLKGYASPEGNYKHNVELAKGRTEALRGHLQSLYEFGEGVMSTDYEPENWQGLREYVEKSNLEHRTEILSMIDSDMEPDAKEAKIKRTYATEYKFLLENCYPYLRKTDYRISYTVKAFTDIEVIRRVFAAEPSKLSLNELYMLAQDYEPGTDEFTEVFETAARMYPESCEANLNASTAAIRHGDLETARKYLLKAGESGEADYNRGVVAAMEGDYTSARPLFESAKAKGVSEADYCLDYISRY